MALRAKRTHHRVNENIPLDLSEAKPEGDPKVIRGRLCNFVRRGTPRWGTAVDDYDLVAILKGTTTFKPNEVGHHTVILIYFDKGADGVWRFVQVVTDEVRVTP
jgi:hypothetical protein